MSGIPSMSGLCFCVDEKPATYDFANVMRKMTGAEVMAAFAGSNANG